MQRLREQSSSVDPATARAAALLATMPPLDVDRLRPRPLPPLEAAHRRGAGRLRFALVFAMSLGTVAAGAATLRGTGWLGGLRHPDVQAPAPSRITAPSPSSPRKPSRTPGEEGPADPPSAEAAPTTPTTEAAAEDRARSIAPAQRAHSTSGGQSHAASKEVVHGTPTASGEDESGLLVGAVRALRRDGDAARAQALAEESLQRYPRGAQVEEAMALAMEAASAGGDSSAAHRDAKRYLATFPSGRFSDRAARILASPSK